jgi:hypothetical protein
VVRVFGVFRGTNSRERQRFQNGASSSRKIYRSSFIPGLHDVCMIFEKV